MLSSQEQMEIIKAALSKGYDGPIYELIEQAIIERSAQQQSNPNQTQAPTPALGGKMPAKLPESSTERNIIQPGEYQDGGFGGGDNEFFPNPNLNVVTQVDDESDRRKTEEKNYKKVLKKRDEDATKAWLNMTSAPFKFVGEVLQTPQSLITEGIAHAKGEDYNYSDAVPSLESITGGTNTQRTLSNVIGFEDKPGWDIGGSLNTTMDVLGDPSNLIGIGLLNKATKTTKNINKVTSGYKPQTFRVVDNNIETPKTNIVTKDNINIPTSKETELLTAGVNDATNFYKKEMFSPSNVKKLDEMGPYGNQIKKNWDQSVKHQTYKTYLHPGQGFDVNTLGQSGSLKTRKIGERTEIINPFKPGDDWKMLDYDSPIPRYSQINVSQNLPGYRTMSKHAPGKSITDDAGNVKIITQADVDAKFKKKTGTTTIHEDSHAINLPTNIKGYTKVKVGPKAGEVVEVPQRDLYQLHKNKDLVYDPRQPAIRFGEGLVDDVTDAGATFNTKWNPKTGSFDQEFVPSNVLGDQHNTLLRMKNSKSSDRFGNYLNYRKQPREVVPNTQQFKYRFDLTDAKGYGNIDENVANKLYNKLKKSDPKQYSLFRDKKAFQNIFNKANYGVVPVVGGGSSLLNNSNSSSGYRTGGVKKYKKGGDPVESSPFEFSMCGNAELSGKGVKTGCGYRDSAHNLYGSAGMTIGSLGSDGMSGSVRGGLGYSTHVPYSPITGHVGLSAGSKFKMDENSQKFSPIFDATGSIGIEGELGGNSYNWREPWKYGAGVYGKQDLTGGTGTTVGLYGNVGMLSGKVGYNKNTGAEATLGIGIPIRKTGGFKKVKKCKYGCF